jgi:hypothetical protein
MGAQPDPPGQDSVGACSAAADVATARQPARDHASAQQNSRQPPCIDARVTEISERHALQPDEDRRPEVGWVRSAARSAVAGGAGGRPLPRGGARAGDGSGALALRLRRICEVAETASR